MFKNLFSFSKQPASAAALKTLTPEMFSLLTQLPTAVLLLEKSGKVAFANETAALLLGRAAEKLVGLNVSKLGISAARLKELQEGETSAKQVLEIVDSQANALVVNAGAKLLGETSFILLTLEESPQLRRLTEEKAFFESVLNNYPSAVTVQDLQGNYIFGNTQAQQLFGFTAKQARETALYQLLPKELVSSLQRLDEEVVTGKTQAEAVRLEYQSAQGAERMLSVVKTVVSGADRKAQFILTVYEEITKHYQWEQDLQRSQKLLEAILNNIPLGVYTRDSDTKVTFINRQGPPNPRGIRLVPPT